MIKYVVIHGKPNVRSLCFLVWKTPQWFAQILLYFLGDSGRTPHDTVAPFVLCLDFSFWFWVLHPLSLGPVVKPQLFKWMHSCLLVLTSVFVDIFLALWWLSWCFAGGKRFLLSLRAGWGSAPIGFFPSPMPRGLNLSQSYSVPEVGVVEVKSYMTTPIIHSLMLFWTLHWLVTDWSCRFSVPLDDFNPVSPFNAITLKLKTDILQD